MTKTAAELFFIVWFLVLLRSIGQQEEDLTIDYRGTS